MIVNKRTPTEEYECVDIDTICRESDIITVHTPLSDETYGLINEKCIAKMKKNVILINVARGAVFDDDLIAAAGERHIQRKAGILPGFLIGIALAAESNGEGRGNVAANDLAHFVEHGEFLFDDGLEHPLFENNDIAVAVVFHNNAADFFRTLRDLCVNGCH